MKNGHFAQRLIGFDNRVGGALHRSRMTTTTQKTAAKSRFTRTQFTAQVNHRGGLNTSPQLFAQRQCFFLVGKESGLHGGEFGRHD